MAEIILKKGEGRSLKAGGPWIYDNEIAGINGSFENGDLVDILDFDGYFLGRGFINTNSKIRVRIMSRKKGQEIDDEFLAARVRDAWEYRKRTVDTGSCRIIFGEADFLPGLVVDKYVDVLVVQSLALGIDRIKSRILTLLMRMLKEDGIFIRGIYERSDAKVRKLEGMEPTKGFLSEPFDTKITMEENGVFYQVDIKEGQKTGFFLDQKYNRLAIQKLSYGMRVLDCFTHTGSFALNAGVGGAREVLGVYLTGHPLEDYEEKWKKGISKTTLDFQIDDETGRARVVDGTKETIGGMITAKTVKYTKTNQIMAFLTIEDLAGTV